MPQALIHDHHLVTCSSSTHSIPIHQYNMDSGYEYIADRTTFDNHNMVPSIDALYFHWKRACWAIPELSWVSTKQRYIHKLQKEPNLDKIVSLPHMSRGRPLTLGQYDCEVAEYIRSLHAAWGIVNWSITIAAAMGILSHWNPAMECRLCQYSKIPHHHDVGVSIYKSSPPFLFSPFHLQITTDICVFLEAFINLRWHLYTSRGIYKSPLAIVYL